MTPELTLQPDNNARRPMGEGHLTEEQFGELIGAKEVIILRIPDEFSYMDPRLIEILKEKVTPRLSMETGV